MPTQTDHTNAPAAPAQDSHHWVITVELPGRMASTLYGTYTPAPTMTRHDVFMAIKDEVARNNPEMARANVVFFALEPNQL